MIESGVNIQVLNELNLIEKTNGVKILLAVESGSRAWGFASPNSDYDVRFIYLRPISWYLSVSKRRDVIELPLNGLLDMNGWDLKKALLLLVSSNPSLNEWLQSPHIYHTTNTAHGLSKLAADHFNPKSVIYHYLHMAVGNYRTYLQGDEVQLKKYLYVLRPLFCCLWIEQHHAMPPVSIDELMAAVGTANVPEESHSLIAAKRAGEELAKGQRVDSLNLWIEEKIAHFGKAAKLAPKPSLSRDDPDEFMVQTLMAELRRESLGVR